MDICFLTCICLWQISQIQTRLFNVVGPGLFSTSPAFVRSSASYPAGPHDRLAQKNGKTGTHCWGRDGSTQFVQQLVSTVTAPPLVGCVVWSQFKYIISFIVTYGSICLNYNNFSIIYYIIHILIYIILYIKTTCLYTTYLH